MNTSSNKTNFEKVIDFNDGFGVPVNNTIQTDIFKQNTDLVKLRLDLILEEVKELKDAIDTHDMTETIDALADILYVVYGAGASFGINLDKTFDIVHKSNMSKLCETEKDAIETVRIYKEKYANNNSPYDSPTYRCSKDNKYWVVYNESTGKILKNYKYTPANFQELE
jgi:predicted HAD superfamily Cof-like phosphohydrolase